MQSSILFMVLSFCYGFFGDEAYSWIEGNYVILSTKIEKSTSYPDGKKKNRSTNQNLRLVCDKPTILSGLHEESIETDARRISKKELQKAHFK